jgi:hypothetical protein
MSNLFYEDIPFNEYDHEIKRKKGVSFTIDKYCRWYHHTGAHPGPIKKYALAKLFSGSGSGIWYGRGLSRDVDGVYWISQPESKYKVEVEDVPFLIVNLTVLNKGEENQLINVFTNFEEEVEVGPDHKAEIRKEPGRGQDVLYIEVRDGLFGKAIKSVNDEVW